MHENTQTPEEYRKTGRLIKWAVIVAIVVVLNLFFNYTISLIYKTPTFEGFCPSSITNVTYTDQTMCTKAGGQWNQTTEPVPADGTGMTNPVKVTGYCNATYTCSQQFDNAQNVYNRNVFIILVILGVLAIALGAYLAHFSGAVALGFSFGGVIALITGATRYWSNMQDALRVVVLAIALAALVWVGIKKIKE